MQEGANPVQNPNEHLEKQPESKVAIHRRLPLFLPGLILFVGVFLSTAVLYHPNTGWNVNTRLALLFAVADQGTLTIDDYHGSGMPTETGDKAFFEGHHYSDKIFGVTLLALPAYWVARTLAGESLPFVTGHWIAKTFAVSIPAAASVLLFFLLLVRLGAPPRRSVMATFLLFYGSIWFGYSTIFFPYAPALACCLGALYVTFFPPAGRLTVANCFAVGFLLGFALLCELTMAFLVAGIGMMWLMRVGDQAGVLGMRAFAEMTGERTRMLHTVIFGGIFWVGVLLPLSLFAAYSWFIFGHLTIPYKYEVDELFREGMAQGIMGITSPKLAPLYYVTFHPFRGLFFWTPLLLLALAGLVAATQQYGKRRIVGWLGIYTLVAYLLFNAGYYMWWGGWAMGPRFLIPLIPIVGLGLGELLREGKLSMTERFPAYAKALRLAVYTVGLIGLLGSFPLSISEPQTPQGNPTTLLLNAGFAEPPRVPQFRQISMVFRGLVTVSPMRRAEGIVAQQDPIENYLSIFLYSVLLILLPGYLTWKNLPTLVPGAHRRDYPFATVDGAAAPPPPPKRPT